MSEIVQFLNEVGTFYLATVEGDKPKVRPFGLVIEHEGKYYFGTSNEKEVYKQLQVNPFFEVSATSSTGKWVRLKGKAVFDHNQAVKVKSFEILPMLSNVYGTPDNPIFEVFYIAEGEATFYTFTEAPRTVKL